MPTQIPTQTLYRDDDPKTLNLAMYFTHDGDITYTASALPPGVVMVAVEGATLTLTPETTNQAVVTVMATAAGKTTTSKFTVDVMPRSEPDEPEPMTTLEDVPSTLSITPTATMAYGEVTLPASHTLSETSDVVDVMEKVAANTDSATMNVWKVEALKKGEAEVSVLDASSTSVKTIMVTVTANLPVGDCPSSIVLAPTESTECTVGAGQTLLPEDRESLTVVATPDDPMTYKITALKKGDTMIEVYEGTSIVDHIMVDVTNRPPVKKADMNPAIRYTMVADLTGDDVSKIPAIHTGYIYKVAIPVATFFEDPDGDTLEYELRSSRPSHAVIAGWDKDGTKVFVDVLSSKSKFGTFDIIATAKDKDPKRPGESAPVRFTVTSADPLSPAQTYYALQHPDDPIVLVPYTRVGAAATTAVKVAEVGFRDNAIATLAFVSQATVQMPMSMKQGASCL